MNTEARVLSRWILAARLAILLLGVWAVWFAFTPISAPSVPLGASYTCAMHPDVKSPTAGDCPICGMALGLAATGATGGMSPEQADAVEGAASPPGRVSVKPVVGHVFSQALEAPAWIDDQRQLRVLLYNDEVSALPQESELVASFEGAPPVRLSVKRAAAPASGWDEATALVTFRFESGVGIPATGSVGRLLLPARRRNVLVVPQEALLAGDHGAYVLVRSGDALQKRPVTLGKLQYDMATIVAGLTAHESVVVRNAFLLDAERRFRSPSERMP